MSHKIKVETACIKCGTPTLVFFSHKDDAKCRECLANELAKKHQQDGMKKAIKDAATYVEDIEFEFDKEFVVEEAFKYDKIYEFNREINMEILCEKL